MKNAFILLSLFSLSLSIANYVVDLGQKIEFDSLQNKFTIAYRGPQRNLFLLLISHEKENLGFELQCSTSHSTHPYIYYKDYGYMFFITAGGECELTFNVDDGDKGNFTIYDFRASYEIKLKNIYGNIKMNLDYYTAYEDDDQKIGLANKLTFLVPNFRTNSNITFEYEKNRPFYNLPNPFKVCHENVCKENVTNYYFEKGKSYQIYVKVLTIKESYSSWYNYAVPPFRFYANDSEEEYSNDDIKYTYEGIQPPSSSNYRQMSILILVLLTSLLF